MDYVFSLFLILTLVWIGLLIGRFLDLFQKLIDYIEGFMDGIIRISKKNKED